MKRDKKYIIGFLFLLFFMSTFTHKSNINAAEPIANLTLRIYDGGKGVFPEYANLIAEQLSAIGINLDIDIVLYSIDYTSLLLCYDYDLILTEFDFSLVDPDPTKYFYSESPYNYVLFDVDLPYGNQSENLLKEALSITNSTERRLAYIEWSNLVMDKIISVYPLFNPRAGSVSWPNLKGNDIRWDLSECLPHMYFDNIHINQNSTLELSLAHDSNWRNLFSLYHFDKEEENINSLLSDKLIYGNFPFSDVKGGLLEKWDKHNETHYTFYVRDNLFWNPSVNISGRNSNSIPLSNITDIDLVRGLKNNEFSNGMNQQLTAKDVIFTLLSYSSEILGQNPFEYCWIKNLELNQTNELAFDLYIDANPLTLEQEPYAPLWSKLSIPCLPEFFLNSTNNETYYTSGGIPFIGLYPDTQDTEQWIWYSKSAFGCGKYMLDYRDLGNETVLRASPYWHGIDYMLETPGNLSISTIKFTIIPDYEDMVENFYDGLIDIYYYDDIVPYIPFEPYFEYQSKISARTTCLLFNLRRPFIGGTDNFVFLDQPDKEEYTKGIAVRKAICYAIDKDTINDVVNDGQHRSAIGLVNDIHFESYLSEVFHYYYDLETAYYWLGIPYLPSTPTYPTTSTETIVSTEPTITTISFNMKWMYTSFIIIILLKNLQNRRKKIS